MTARAGIYLAVAVGSALGALARVGAGDLVGVTGFPWATLGVNALGSFLIGLYGALSAPGGRLSPRPATRRFVMDGFCGGFTTFSVFSLEAVELAATGAWVAAGLYTAASFAVWMVSVLAGHALAQRAGGD